MFVIPNELRPSLGTQEWIVRTINMLGFNPFIDTPIHLWSAEQIAQLRAMYREAKPYGGDYYRDQDVYVL